MKQIVAERSYFSQALFCPRGKFEFLCPDKDCCQPLESAGMNSSSVRHCVTGKLQRQHSAQNNGVLWFLTLGLSTSLPHSSRCAFITSAKKIKNSNKQNRFWIYFFFTVSFFCFILAFTWIPKQPEILQLPQPWSVPKWNAIRKCAYLCESYNMPGFNSLKKVN